MRTTLTIHLEDSLLKNVAQFFANEPEPDYSKAIETALLYFLQLQIHLLKNQEYDKIQANIDLALKEPKIDFEKLDNDYSFTLSSIEGSWPGSESVEELVGMLSK